MDLPDGFHWTRRHQYDPGANAIALGSDVVCYLDQRVDDHAWVAWLECLQAMPAPIVTRRCQSLESGREGCVMWVCRHEERLRREAAAHVERRRLNRHAAVR